MAVFSFNRPTKETYSYFKKNTWYKGKGSEKGITAFYGEKPDGNNGWWSGAFAYKYFSLVTPELWDEITDEKEIEELNEKLKEELKECQDALGIRP